MMLLLHARLLLHPFEKLIAWYADGFSHTERWEIAPMDELVDCHPGAVQNGLQVFDFED